MFKKVISLTILFIFFITVIVSFAITPFTSKPSLGATINWSHPLSKGLVGAWLMNEGGGRIVRDLISSSTSFIDGAIWNNSAKGKVIYFDGANDSVDLGGKYNPGSNPFTILIWLQTSHVNSLAISTCSVAGQQGYEFLIGSGGVAGTNVFRITGSLSTGGFTAATGLNDNKYHQYVGTYWNTEGSWYVDGKLISDNATNPGTINNSQNLKIARRGSTYCQENVSLVSYYNRVLSPQEIQQLYIEPYCFINPPTPWTVWGAISGGVTTYIKTINGLIKGSIKTWNGNAIGTVKTVNGLP